jgi:catechol 2,3-dioxygenase-like lactoylglutathione lyase family enzyme
VSVTGWVRHGGAREIAFLVSDEDFDAAFARIRQAGIAYYADPHLTRPGEINHNHGGRGVYFMDPAGHGLEIITRPYGGHARPTAP